MNEERTYWWGSDGKSIRTATEHFLIAGATGSGKTVTLKVLMHSILEDQSEVSTRMLVFDSKREFYPVVHAFGVPKENIHIFNPFDARCVQWDLASDITGFADAEELAAILIPSADEQTPYFRNVSRLLVAMVMKIFIHVHRKTEGGVQWTLRDLICVLKLPNEALKELFMAFPFAAHAIFHFGNDETASNIRSTLAVFLAQYEIVAALWDSNGQDANKVALYGNRRVLSLQKHWIESPSTLIVGREPALQSALQPLNQALIHRAIQLVLGQAEKTHETEDDILSWFFLDELNSAGRLDMLPDLLKQGRSKGACVVLGVQNLDGLITVYEESAAMDLVSQCSNKALLRLQDTKTAQWAADLVGEQMFLKSNTSTNSSTQSSPQGVTWSTGRSRDSRLERDKIASPSTFWRSIRPAGRDNGIEGFFFSPGDEFGHQILTVDAEQLFGPDSPLMLKSELAAVEKRDETEQELRMWDEEDLKRLGFERFPLILEIVRRPGMATTNPPEESQENVSHDLTPKQKSSLAGIVRRI
jgi:hypothetical protein